MVHCILCASGRRSHACGSFNACPCAYSLPAKRIRPPLTRMPCMMRAGRQRHRRAILVLPSRPCSICSSGASAPAPEAATSRHPYGQPCSACDAGKGAPCSGGRARRRQPTAPTRQRSSAARAAHQAADCISSRILLQPAASALAVGTEAAGAIPAAAAASWGVAVHKPSRFKKHHWARHRRMPLVGAV